MPAKPFKLPWYSRWFSETAEFYILAEQTLVDAITRFQVPLSRYARHRLISDPDVVDDLLQEVWERYYSFLLGLDLYELGESSRHIPLLLTMLKRAFSNYKRENARFVSTESLPVNNLWKVLQESQFDQPEAVISRKETVRQLEEAIRDLPKFHIFALYYRFCEDMTHKEIAEKLGRPINTVKSDFSRGMKKFRDILVGKDAARAQNIDLLDVLETIAVFHGAVLSKPSPALPENRFDLATYLAYRDLYINPPS